MSNIQILKRLYKDYSKKFLKKILISVFFSVLVAGSTASIAWLLDPAIKKIFIDKNPKPGVKTIKEMYFFKSGVT